MLIDIQVEKIKPGGLYLFIKSCNWVTAIERLEKGFWQVRRVDTGKEMIVSERALISEPEQYGIEVCESKDPRKKLNIEALNVVSRELYGVDYRSAHMTLLRQRRVEAVLEKQEKKDGH